jgi:hypothetical protein
VRSLGLEKSDRRSKLLLLLSRELVEPLEPFIGDLDFICYLALCIVMHITTTLTEFLGRWGGTETAPLHITFRGCRRGVG